MKCIYNGQIGAAPRQAWLRICDEVSLRTSQFSSSFPST